MLCVCVRNTRKFAIVAHFMFSSCGDLYGEYNRIDAVYEYENWCNAFQIGPFSFDMNRRHIKLGENIVVSDLSGYLLMLCIEWFRWRVQSTDPNNSNNKISRT